jgi:hypothetical protein
MQAFAVDFMKFLERSHNRLIGSLPRIVAEAYRISASMDRLLIKPAGIPEGLISASLASTKISRNLSGFSLSPVGIRTELLFQKMSSDAIFINALQRAIAR